MGSPVVFFEIGCRDRAATSAFYASLFGWETTAEEHSTTIATNADGGINGHIAALGHEPHAYTMFYVEVDDLDATLAAAATLGGTTIVGPLPIPDGRFAWCRDPEGNTIGVMERPSG